MFSSNKETAEVWLDIHYPNIKSIVITGSNGKSTACKIIEHVLKKNNINTKLGGNIGKPILIVSGGKGTADDKMEALKDAGIHVCESPSDLGSLMQKLLKN